MKTDYINPDTINSLHDLLKTRATRNPHSIAYQYFSKEEDSWQSIDWKTVCTKVLIWANALAHEKLEPGDRVAILIKNSLEWVLFEQACFVNQLIVVPLYPEDRAENVAYIINDTHTKLLLVDGHKHLQKLTLVQDQLSTLKAIISIDENTGTYFQDRVTPINTWLDKPTIDISPPNADRHSLASIVYTSGTTGKPKGVMLSHDNIMQDAWSGVQSIDVYPSDHFLSFLPISHMLERTVGYYIPMLSGASVSFSRSIADLANDMLTQNPSIMITVPRIFERVYNKVDEKLSQKSIIIQTLFHYSIDIAWKHFQYKQNKSAWNIQFLLLPLFNQLFHKNIRDKFGNRFRFAISGGAALDFKIAQLFISLGVVIAQGYGLTEFSPVISVNRLEDNDPKSVGKILPGVIITTDNNEELLVKGKSLMKGYWNNEIATREIIDEYGWLHTGDKAKIVNENIYITGRLKDIIVLSTGEKIPPCEVEQSIAQDPLFENIVVVGENRPYLSALVIPNDEMVKNMVNSTDSLNEELLKHIRVKMSSFPGYAKIHKVSICEDPWTIENGMLTPTLKPRRQYIIDNYKNIIDDMYKK